MSPRKEQDKTPNVTAKKLDQEPKKYIGRNHGQFLQKMFFSKILQLVQKAMSHKRCQIPHCDIRNKKQTNRNDRQFTLKLDSSQ